MNISTRGAVLERCLNSAYWSEQRQISALCPRCTSVPHCEVVRWAFLSLSVATFFFPFLLSSNTKTTNFSLKNLSPITYCVRVYINSNSRASGKQIHVRLCFIQSLQMCRDLTGACFLLTCAMFQGVVSMFVSPEHPSKQK